MTARKSSNGTFNICIRVVMIVVLMASDCQWTSPTVVDGARVLAIETIAAKSRWNFMSAVLRSLTDAGHEVLVFTQFPDGDRENYTEVDTSADFHMRVDLNLSQLIATLAQPLKMIDLTHGMNRALCDTVYGNRRLAALMRNAATTGGTKDFDVIITEPLGGTHCMSYLADTLDLPLIYTIPSPMITCFERTFTGHLSNPAIVPHMLVNHAVPNTFARRFVNAVLYAYELITTECYEQFVRLTDPRPYDSSPTITPSVIFHNSHFASESSSVVATNLINVGGIHLKPAKSIPKNILDFIEDSPHGVIYFTFGSTIKMTTLPEHIENVFKGAFARVQQKVLWKYEGDMKDKPKNILTRKSFPQRDILLHPNIKLFISHGGISGVYEAVDAGVPVLGFPIFYDQPRNIDHLVYNGMAISMDLLSVTEEKLLNAIVELVNNEMYANNARTVSARFKDRPMSPQQLAVYWIEYVIRHRGATHLKSAGRNLSWYQYFILDAIAVMSLVVTVVLYVIYRIFKFLSHKFLFRYSNNYIKVKCQ